LFNRLVAGFAVFVQQRAVVLPGEPPGMPCPLLVAVAASAASPIATKVTGEFELPDFHAVSQRIAATVMKPAR